MHGLYKKLSREKTTIQSELDLNKKLSNKIVGLSTNWQILNKDFDDIISKDYQNKIKSILVGETRYNEDDFPWYYNNGIVGPHQKNKYQFVHTFFNCDINFSNLHNEYYNFIDPCLHKLGVKHLKRVKANLNPKTIFHRNGGFHCDIKNVTTSIFYINTNNGWTKFKDGCKVECIEIE